MDINNIYDYKWLIGCCYYPKKSDITNYLNKLRKAIGVCSSKYDEILLTEDFNCEFSDSVITSI